VVDFGCGTGILAIGALKLGAARAFGVDIDAVAVEAAKSNAVINGVQDRFKAVLGDGTETNADEPTDVDVLVANILVTPNLELASKFVNMTRKGGKIGLSGILAGKQAEAVIQRYSEEGCAEFEVYERDEWVCIECTKL
jgi:ribosomal protein L11 methyltransferase